MVYYLHPRRNCASHFLRGETVAVDPVGVVAFVPWDVMGDARAFVPVCETCADWADDVHGAFDDDDTFSFWVDGRIIDGVVRERFNSGRVVIDGTVIASADLPAVVVDCGDSGSWLVPTDWEVK